jgi:ABC-type antimicrobial peptide transport system permease subunit
VAFPETYARESARAESLRERLTGPVRPAFMLLLGGAVLVLIVAGINLAGLQVARNLARAQELTVRRALGAARGRIIRQLTTETLVLSLFGGAAGIAAASATLRGLAMLAPTVAWYDISPTLTAPVIIYTCLITLAAGLAIGHGAVAQNRFELHVVRAPSDLRGLLHPL